jgi:hypothetical protein
MSGIEAKRSRWVRAPAAVGTWPPTAAHRPYSKSGWQLSCRPEHETGKWSGRRVSNPRHSAWKAATSERCGTVLRSPSESCPVIVS